MWIDACGHVHQASAHPGLQKMPGPEAGAGQGFHGQKKCLNDSGWQYTA